MYNGGNGIGVIQEDILEFIRKRNKSQSDEFTNAAAQISRRLYRNQHPTEILVFKCMDGRLNLAHYTETPVGILQPFRNIGGQFDFGWPFFQEVVNDSVNYAIGKGRRCVLITSYHFSKGDHHRGCAGFEYDTNGAQIAAFALRDQGTRVYGDARGREVYALTIGIETDEEALTFHGKNGEELRVAELSSDVTEEEVRIKLEKLYPDMNGKMLSDIIPLVRGNATHITKLRTLNREPIDLEHREQIIAVGRGFDWLHMPNTALIIGPYSHAWPQAVQTAGSIIRGNLEASRISSQHGIALLVSALHREEDGTAGYNLKQEKVRYLLREAKAALENVPEIQPHLRILGGVVVAETRLLHPMDLS